MAPRPPDAETAFFTRTIQSDRPTIKTAPMKQAADYLTGPNALP